MKKLAKYLIVAISFFWISLSNAAVIEGNENGSITMAYIYDYQCPICHQMYPMMQQLITEFPNLKIRMMPVAVKNMTSLYEASAAIAATHSNQFQAFNDKVMNQAPMSDPEVTALLNQMGLNSQQFKDAMHSQAVKQQLMQGQAQMDASGHSGVPLFIIYPSQLDPSHSLVVAGYQSLATMQAAIQEVQQKIDQAHAAAIAAQAGS